MTSMFLHSASGLQEGFWGSGHHVLLWAYLRPQGALDVGLTLTYHVDTVVGMPLNHFSF